MKRYITMFMVILISSGAFCQMFSGKVSSEDGEGIAFATIYIRELSQGIVTDDNGYYQTQIASGSYTVDVSSLGYNQQTLNLFMPRNGLKKDITLTEKVYQLREVRVTRNNEDPAYAVMRKAIAHAPFYRNHIRKYSAETYMKGSAIVKKIPGILKINKEVREEVKKIEDKLFVIEEQRIVTFTAPNNWDNKVMAYRNSFPEDFDLDIETTNINLYNPKLFDKISPLAPGSFSYYKFRLEGCYTENGWLVNKIRIIPRKNSPDLLSGFIYIIEDLWSVSAAHVKFSEMGVKADVQVNCKEVKPAVFLPVSVSLECVVNLLGIKADASYLTAMKYGLVEASDDVSAGDRTLTEVVAAPVVKKRVLSGKQRKVQEKIDKLAQKEDLSTRDAYKLSRLLTEKENLEADTVSSHKTFQRPERKYHSSIKRDSLAGLKDSVYWANVRSVPLRPEELESYAKKAKLTAKADTLHQDSENSESYDNDNSNVFDVLINGETFHDKNKKSWISFNGFSSFIGDYNFVDGLWVGARFKVGTRFSKSTTLTLDPQAYYTTARKEWVGKGILTLDYAPRLAGKLVVDGGRISEDYNKETGESRWTNAMSSLLFARNEIKFYDRTYLSVSNDIEVANGLFLHTGVNWERRSMLDNHVANSIFKREANPNIPGNTNYIPMPDNEALTATASLRFTPAHYYRLVRGRKIYEDPKYPTFILRYDRAFGLDGSRISPSYNKMELTAKQKVEFGMFNNFYWLVNGGTFWNSEHMQFPDFKQFASTRLILTGRSFNEGFSLLNNYEFATADRWLQANITWQAPYILLKNLPFLRKQRFDEALHIRALAIRESDIYWEAGYSLGFGKDIRAGIFTGFERMKYRSIGFSMVVNLGDWD